MHGRTVSVTSNSVAADIVRLRDDSRALVDDVAAEVIDSLHVFADEAEVTFSLAREPEALVALPAATLCRCVLALVDNALVHSPAGGEIHLEVSVTRAGKKRSASLAVTDQGAGIQGIDPARIFDRFAHAAPRPDGPAARQGFGIGLALVKDVATRRGGDVTVEASSRAGTTLVLTLPLRLGENTAR
ncbi:sensor histidine kinase [Frigoribacterium sp. 2-23]|uniref:sensor histidine kinase n=1 Tax=Frigoribacterium sp. 2-23 TaxID=3415006 RepID=UPI003C70606E